MTPSDSPNNSQNQSGQASEPASGSGESGRWGREILIQATALIIAIVFLVSIWLLARPIAILLAAIIIAMALAPLVEMLERWLPRAIAAIIVYVALVLIVVGIIAALGTTIASQIETFIEEAPSRLETARDWINQRLPFGEDQLVQMLQGQGSQLGSIAARLPVMIVSTVAEIIIAFSLSLYWVIALPSIRRFTLSLFPNEDRRHKAGETLSDVGRTMGGYVRGITLDGTIMGIVTYVGLMIIGVDFAIALAVFSGLSVLVPIIGPIVASVPAIGIALIDSPLKALIVLIFYVAIQQLESNVLLPNIIRREADIPQLLGIFAVFAGGSIGGILGALIAVPLAGGLRVIIIQVVAPAIRNR